MKPLVFSLLFAAVCCIVIPIYGQEKTTQPTPYKQSVENTASQTGASVNQSATQVQGNGSIEQPHSYFYRLFSPENLPNIGLFIAGVVGIVVAVRTLKSINKQAGLMEGQLKEMQDAGRQTSRQIEITQQTADAGMLNAKAVISAERAWVLANIDYPSRPHTYYEFSIFFTNHGPTPARIESFFWETRAVNSLDDLPPTPVYGAAQYSGRLLAPQESWNVDKIFPNVAVSMERWIEIMKDKNKFVICIGYVQYSGIFEGSRCSKFCFGYNGNLERFTAVGPHVYNDYT